MKTISMDEGHYRPRTLSPIIDDYRHCCQRLLTSTDEEGSHGCDAHCMPPSSLSVAEEVPSGESLGTSPIENGSRLRPEALPFGFADTGHTIAPEDTAEVPPAGKGLPQRLSSLYTYRTFGHPHASPHYAGEIWQSNPFWHQYPKWSTPGNRLQHDPSRNVFSYYGGSLPVIDACLPTAALSLSTGRPKVAPSSAARRSSREPVELYLGCTFVQKVPLVLLLRFSELARRSFKKELSCLSEHVRHHKPRSAEEPISASQTQHTSELNVDDLLQNHARLPTSFEHVQDRLNSPSRFLKRLILDLDAPKLPSLKAIKSIIEWMQIVEPLKAGNPLPDFAPSAALAHIDLVDLFDLYAAVRTFNLRPRKVWLALMDELRARVSVARPTLALLQLVHERIPMNDVVMTRALSAVVQHRGRGAFVDGGWEEMRNFLFASGGPRLAARAEAILGWHDAHHADESHIFADEDGLAAVSASVEGAISTEPSLCDSHFEGLVRPTRGHIDLGLSEASMRNSQGGKLVSAASTPPSRAGDTDASQPRRRRKRRQQQRRGREVEDAKPEISTEPEDV